MPSSRMHDLGRLSTNTLIGAGIAIGITRLAVLTPTLCQYASVPLCYRRAPPCFRRAFVSYLKAESNMEAVLRLTKLQSEEWCHRASAFDILDCGTGEGCPFCNIQESESCLAAADGRKLLLSNFILETFWSLSQVRSRSCAICSITKTPTGVLRT